MIKLQCSGSDRGTLFNDSMRNEDPIEDENPSANHEREFRAEVFSYRQQGPERLHLHGHQLAVVGACFEALACQPAIQNCVARGGGLDDLNEVTAARHGVLAALHDTGEVNISFRTQIWPSSELACAVHVGIDHVPIGRRILNRWSPRTRWDRTKEWDVRAQALGLPRTRGGRRSLARQPGAQRRYTLSR